MTKNVVRSGLRLGEDLNNELRLIARDMCITKNQLMVKILWDWVKKERENGRMA